MGIIFSNCFTCKEKDSHRRSEEEEEEKHHEKRNGTDLVDRISDLPDDLLHLILSFLPFDSVRQTSVLSRRWNRVWSSYPIFDFYDIFTCNEALHHQIRARIINTVLARQDGDYNIKHPCLKIPLSRSSLGQFRRVGEEPSRDSCFARVEELVLDISSSSENTEKTYALPQCQLKCLSLRSSSCENSRAWLGFPSSYVVWSFLLSLRKLSLSHVHLLDSTTGASGVNLFSGSSFPCLEKLKIDFCSGISDLKICCPNLKYISVFDMNLNSIDISGVRLERLSVSFCFANCINGSCVKIFAPNLKSFSWIGNYITDKCFIQSFPALVTSELLWPRKTTRKISINSTFDLFTSSSQAVGLDISSNFLQILSKIYFELGGLPFSYMKLKTLHICLDVHLGNTYIPAWGIACLFRSSPKVENLRIEFHMYSSEGNHRWNNKDDTNCTEEQQCWESQAQYLIPFLGRLKVVNIRLDKVPDTAVTFARLFLKYGRGLRELILRIHRDNSTLPPNLLNDTVALIEGLPRASANVKVSTYWYGSY